MTRTILAVRSRPVRLSRLVQTALGLVPAQERKTEPEPIAPSFTVREQALYRAKRAGRNRVGAMPLTSKRSITTKDSRPAQLPV